MNLENLIKLIVFGARFKSSQYMQLQITSLSVFVIIWLVITNGKNKPNKLMGFYAVDLVL